MKANIKLSYSITNQAKHKVHQLKITKVTLFFFFEKQTKVTHFLCYRFILHQTVDILEMSNPKAFIISTLSVIYLKYIYIYIYRFIDHSKIKTHTCTCLQNDLIWEDFCNQRNGLKWHDKLIIGWPMAEKRSICIGEWNWNCERRKIILKAKKTKKYKNMWLELGNQIPWGRAITYKLKYFVFQLIG